MTLTSCDWSLKGDSDTVLKDSRFMSSFDIKLFGKLAIGLGTPSTTIPNRPPIVEAIASVNYCVEGCKPR